MGARQIFIAGLTIGIIAVNLFILIMAVWQ